MVSWADAHRKGLVTALRLHRDRGSTLTERVPVFELAADLGIVTGFGPLPRLAGAYFREPPGMRINTRHPLAKQRYTAGHEIGHHVFGHASSFDVETDLAVATRGVPDHEKEAEAFAAWLLMPRQLVLAHLAGRDAASPADVYQVALRMGTSYDATSRHLLNLKLINQAAFEQLQVAPRSIKAALVGDPPVGIGHNDVHVVGPAEADTYIYACPGDLLVVRTNSDGSPPGVVDAGQLAETAGPSSFRLEGVDERLRVIDLPPQNPEIVAPSTSVVVGIGDSSWSFTLVVEPPRKGVAERWFL